MIDQKKCHAMVLRIVRIVRYCRDATYTKVSPMCMNVHKSKTNN